MSLFQEIIDRGLTLVVLSFLGLLANTVVIAGDPRVIELVDGSQLAGEIVLFEHGVYTIESESLGRLHIPSSDIGAIRSSPATASSTSSLPADASLTSRASELSEIESQLLGDPTILSMVTALQKDPDILEVLNDPVIMQAISDRDYSALQNNPKILELEKNPELRRILDLFVPR